MPGSNRRYGENLHELIFLACNTQVKWGTLLNFSALPRLHLPGVQRDLVEQLCRLADYLAYIGRTPRDVASHRSIRSALSDLSDGKANLVYHHIAEVRGVITNLIQNAALEAWESDDCVPLLYAPSGVVYLARTGAYQVPAVAPIGDAVVERIRKIGRTMLTNNLTGFGRDGKGLKHAAYYELFFDDIDMVTVGFHATTKIIHPNKEPGGKTMGQVDALDGSRFPRSLMDDVRVDQLAEWCYLAEKSTRDLPGGETVPQFLLGKLELADLLGDFLAVPRDTRAGGVGYQWYFAAGHYLQRNPGFDPQAWQERIRNLAVALAEYLRKIRQSDSSTQANSSDDGFGDLRRYVSEVLTFGPIGVDSDRRNGSAPFEAEFGRYSAAKKRGKEAMCSLCSSPYTVR
ncbi:MAG: type I-D CRISPR-associated protein Cas10d/Csc3 [Anaerolineales bacterium]|nr:type I-D CRISPR-associated protein Cas10d/Csc3 [Anaerolineales bacterium]